MRSSTPNNRRAKPSAITTGRDPFLSMREEMNDLISRIWYGDADGDYALSDSPAVDIAEDEHSFEIRIDAPGMKTEDFDIEVQGNNVIVRGKRVEETEESDKRFHRIERHRGSFSRGLALPCEINEDEVAAEYDSGVLTLVLPKLEKSRRRRISIK